MKVAVPTEIKNNEFRVAITPAGVHELVGNGHEVLVQSGAGVGSSEPIASEYTYFREGLVLFTYLHLAAEPELTKALVDSKVTAIAYETVQLPTRQLPLLAPMSEVAGRLAPILGANVMLKPNGGPGLLVPGVPGTHPAKVVVLGGGVAGTNAVQVAAGMGAEVTVLDTNLFRLRELDALYDGRIKTIASNSFEIEKACLEADMVIGSVLIPGAKAPKLVSNDLVKRMKPGSVLVDIAVDQGGCFADTHPTTHAEPTFQVHNSLFYCVANMPGAVPNTSTYALTNATLPYLRSIANNGWHAALKADLSLRLGLNTHAGAVTNAPVATAVGMEYSDLDAIFA
ncbi:MAG: hypothetical protein RLY59_1303 [Actinomycetota bacterium]